MTSSPSVCERRTRMTPSSQRTSGVGPFAAQRPHRGRSQPGREAEVRHRVVLREHLAHAREELARPRRASSAFGSSSVYVACSDVSKYATPSVASTGRRARAWPPSVMTRRMDEPAVRRGRRVVARRDRAWRCPSSSSGRGRPESGRRTSRRTPARRFGAGDEVLEGVLPALAAARALDLPRRHLALEQRCGELGEARLRKRGRRRRPP